MEHLRPPQQASMCRVLGPQCGSRPRARGCGTITPSGLAFRKSVGHPQGQRFSKQTSQAWTGVPLPTPSAQVRRTCVRAHCVQHWATGGLGCVLAPCKVVGRGNPGVKNLALPADPRRDAAPAVSARRGRSQPHRTQRAGAFTASETSQSASTKDWRCRRNTGRCLGWAPWRSTRRASL